MTQREQQIINEIKALEYELSYPCVSTYRFIAKDKLDLLYDELNHIRSNEPKLGLTFNERYCR